MDSIFSRELAPEVPLSPYSRQRIEGEIDHLRHGSSVRHREGDNSRIARLISAVALCALLGLFFMDPFIYAFQKYDAMKAYVYLHEAGSDSKAKALASSGILSSSEVRILNERRISGSGDFDSPQQAEQSADSVVNYMTEVSQLRSGRYDQLDPVGKLRYMLFVRMGLTPPVEWSALSPTVKIDDTP